MRNIGQPPRVTVQRRQRFICERLIGETNEIHIRSFCQELQNVPRATSVVSTGRHRYSMSDVQYAGLHNSLRESASNLSVVTETRPRPRLPAP